MSSKEALHAWMSAQTWPDLRYWILHLGTAAYQHPYGFYVFRTPIDWFDGWQVRVHIWPSQSSYHGLLSTNETTAQEVHCHGWDLATIVVLGEVEETSYRAVAGGGTYASYRVRSDLAVGTSQLELVERDLSLIPVENQRRTQGDGIVEIHRGQFHSSRPIQEDFSVTLVSTELTDNEPSYVLAPSNQAHFANERKMITERESLINGCDQRYSRETAGTDDWAAFVFLKDLKGKVLMLRTNRRPELWQPPGGRREASDADPKETLAREVKEELGIELDPASLPDPLSLPRDVGTGQVFFWSIDLDHPLTPLKLKRDEILDLVFIDLLDLESVELYPATRSALQWLKRNS